MADSTESHCLPGIFFDDEMQCQSDVKDADVDCRRKVTDELVEQKF